MSGVPSGVGALVSAYVPTNQAERPKTKYSQQQDDDPWAQAAYGTDSRPRHATGGRDYSSESEMIVPCAGCMNLLGTNADCEDCLASAGTNNLQKLQNSLHYAHLESTNAYRGWRSSLSVRERSRSIFMGVSAM